MNKINKKRVTSVALAFTLAVAAPVKANFSSFDLGLDKVFAADIGDVTLEQITASKTAAEEAKAKAEAAKEVAIAESTAAKLATEKATEAEVQAAEAERLAAKAEADSLKIKTSTEDAKQAATAAREAATAARKAATAARKAATEKVAAESEESKKEKVKTAKIELDKLIVSAKAKEKMTSLYTTKSINDLSEAIKTAEENKNSEDLDTLNAQIKALKAKIDALKELPKEIEVSLNRPTVYYNKVTGRTNPFATVTLYNRNGSVLKYGKADKYGDYSISYDFGYYRDYGYNGTATIDYYGSNYVSGRTTANTYVEAYNGGERVGTSYSDSRGYYTINFNKYVYNSRNTVVYTDGYNNNNYYYNRYYYDLSGYYVQAELNGVYSEKYYLDKAYTDGYYNYNNYAYAPRVTQAIAGTSTVKGSGVNGYATVAVYDSKGIRLGSGTAYSNGEFTISLNRDLKAGEEIKVTANYSNLRENSTTYKVAGEVKKDTYNYTVNLAIGDKRITTTKDGVTTTTTMDVEAYIKDGRTMLPIRFVAQALGYNVTWNDVTRIASFTDGKRVVIINVDSREFYVDGIKNTFSVDPEIKNGRTMLPVSEIGKALGMTTGNKGDNKNIEWDSVRREVKIQLTK